MRMRTVTAALGVTLALGALAGCGGGTGGNGVASLGGDSAQAADGGSTKVSQRDRDAAFRKFTQCMREHGVEMPDPEVSDDGSFAVSAPIAVQSADGSVQPDAGFQEAHEACKKYLEGVVNGADADGPSAAEIEKIQRQALKFARCMRAEGVDFPDPQFNTGSGGGTVMIGGPGEGLDPNDPTFAAAMEKCSKLAGMPRPGKGDVVTGNGATPGIAVRGGDTK